MSAATKTRRVDELMAEEDYQALVHRVRHGDKGALAEFIEFKRPQLLSFVQRSMSPALQRRVDPQDILQEVAVAALESLGSFELGERDPFSWLCQVAERRIVDAHRKHFAAQKRAAGRLRSLDAPPAGTESPAFLELLVSSMTAPSAAFARDQRELRLAEALERLPEVARKALRMRYADAMPTREIALRLGKTDGAIRVTLTRALRTLQEELAGGTWFRPDDEPPSKS